VLKAIWDLTRLEHGFMYGMAVIIGAVIAGSISLDKALLGFTTALFCQASSFALNDYMDYEVDLANKRFDRPIVRGEISRKTALMVAIVLAPLGFISAYLISSIAFVFALAITILGYLYDVKLKEFGFLGNVYIAFTMASPFIFGGIVVGKIPYQIAILALIAFLAGLGREVMKGIEDVKGDELRDVKSVARVKGLDFACKLSAFFIATAVILSLVPFLFIEGYAFDFKYALPIALADYIMLKTSLRLLRHEKNIKALRKDTLIAMGFGLIGFLLGAF